MSLQTVQATLILDNEGRRILAKYYAPRTYGAAGSGSGSGSGLLASASEQKAFEKKLSAQTVGENGDILLLDGRLVVYKQCADLIFYLVCAADANEELIYETLLTLRDSISSLLGHQVDRSNALQHYDRVALAVDETIANGVVISDNKYDVLERVSLQAFEEPSLQNIDLSEGGIKNMFNFAKGRLAQAVRSQLS